MTIVETGVQSLATIGMLVPVIFFTVLTMKVDNKFGSPVLAMMTAGVAYFTGCYAPDIISGNYETTGLGLMVGVAFMMYSLVCLGWSLQLMSNERKG